MNILITGRPGIGKTTFIKDLLQRITKEKASGFYTEEIRIEGQRRGFKIETLDGKNGVLSSIDIVSPYKVSKYKVDLDGFEKIALPAIENGLSESKIIIIDEIGPMELFSQRFKDLLIKALDSPNHVIATIKLKGSKFTQMVKSRSDVNLFNLKPDNKDAVLSEIINRLS